MKITVINIKNIIKNMFIFFIIILLFTIIINKKEYKTKENVIKNKTISLIELLKYEFPIMENLNKDSESESNYNNIGIKILMSQIGILNNVSIVRKEEIQDYVIKEDDKLEIIDNAKKEDEEKEKDNEYIQEIAENEETNIINNRKEVKEILENNINATYTNEKDGVKINNQTCYDISDTINNTTYKINSKKVIIYHTHTCESYTPTEQYFYTMTDSYRTTDLNYTVVRVGDELENELNKYNFEVIHNNTYHDFPSYNGSYGRSLSTLQNIFQSNNDAEIIIDLHRDAIGSDSNYAPRVQIGDEICAQVMFVIGTDGSGLNHPNWRQNLQFAIEVQKKANELYPGLFRPIILRNARYNQHLTTASSIIEVGATGNKLEECLASMKYVAEIFSEM